MTHKDMARAVADTYNPPSCSNPDVPLVCYYRADGTPAVKECEAQYMSRYNPLTKRLKVLLYPHHDMISLFYLGND